MAPDVGLALRLAHPALAQDDGSRLNIAAEVGNSHPIVGWLFPTFSGCWTRTNDPLINSHPRYALILTEYGFSALSLGETPGETGENWENKPKPNKKP
jgi:hypothetical protein